MDSRAIITNIQKYSVHDGPGIRTTVFFKGCPLGCLWCHNPETQSFKKQLMYDEEKCTGCFLCMKGCMEEAIIAGDKKVFISMNKCRLCGRCMDFCPNSARTISGTEYTAADLAREIEKDKVFYEQSGGGVTLSGGEAMAHIDFIEELISLCSKKGISVAIDTCGHVPYEHFERINYMVQLYLYDLKHMDSEKHRLYTGIGNELILSNLKRLSEDGSVINIRIPLIEGINTDDENIKNTIIFLKDIKVHKVNLLPYHDIGKGKYSKLNMSYSDVTMKVPDDETMLKIKCEFEKSHFNVEIGG